MKTAKLKNLFTNQIIGVHATTDSPDSSYGIPCWVDDKGNSYGQVPYNPPLGFEIFDVVEDGDAPDDTEPSRYRMVYDHPLLNSYVPSAKTPHLDALEDAGLLDALTPEQAAKVVIIAQAAYRNGQAAMGAERVDTDAVWVNGVGMIEIVNGEWRLTTPDKPQKSQAATVLGHSTSSLKAEKSRANGRKGGRPRKVKEILEALKNDSRLAGLDIQEDARFSGD